MRQKITVRKGKQLMSGELEEGQTGMSGLLIVYGTKEGQTGRIAETMARIAEEHGVETKLLNGKDAPKDVHVGSYGGVIVAASVHTGHQGSGAQRLGW
jgi:menaquinone-dependent protoporphyrinogen IX oxidase